MRATADCEDERERHRPPVFTRKLAQLQDVERKYAALQEEHDLLKKAIRFCSARKATSSPSSRRTTLRRA